MSEFMMSEGLKRIILRSEQTDDQLWNTIARLYRTYGAEPFDAHIHATSDGNGNGTQRWSDLLCSGCLDSPCHCNESPSCPDCNGCGIRYYRSGEEPCETCGGTGEVNG